MSTVQHEIILYHTSLLHTSYLARRAGWRPYVQLCMVTLTVRCSGRPHVFVMLNIPLPLPVPVRLSRGRQPEHSSTHPERDVRRRRSKAVARRRRLVARLLNQQFQLVRRPAEEVGRLAIAVDEHAHGGHLGWRELRPRRRLLREQVTH